jgi:hypothetical protein
VLVDIVGILFYTYYIKLKMGVYMSHSQYKKRIISNRRHHAFSVWKGRKYRTDVKVGDIIETCSLHLAVVLSVDVRSGDICSKSLFEGYEGMCDLYHCGVVVQTTKQIISKMNVFKYGGMKDIKDLWDSRVLKGIY